MNSYGPSLCPWESNNMSEYIYGKNTVLEKLKKGSDVEEVLLQKGIRLPEFDRLTREKKVPVKYLEKKQLDSLVQHGNHQGVVGIVKEYRYFTIEEIISSIPKSKLPLLVMLDGLEDPHNLGAILRTCDAIGADGVIIGKHRSVGLNGTVAKVSTGAIEHVKVAQVTNLRQTLDGLKNQGYWVVGTDSHEATDYRGFACDMPLVLVVGSEGKGISRIVLEACDFKVALPMVGHVTSLNASVATAILLYQIYSKRNPL